MGKFFLKKFLFFNIYSAFLSYFSQKSCAIYGRYLVLWKPEKRKT